jgi:hypothetical protein
MADQGDSACFAGILAAHRFRQSILLSERGLRFSPENAKE